MYVRIIQLQDDRYAAIKKEYWTDLRVLKWPPKYTDEWKVQISMEVCYYLCKHRTKEMNLYAQLYLHMHRTGKNTQEALIKIASGVEIWATEGEERLTFLTLFKKHISSFYHLIFTM